jgi:hypothetical protein
MAAMSLIGPDRDQFVAAEREFVERAYAYQIDPTAHMAAEGIGGDPPRPSARDIPRIMSLSVLSVMAEAVLRALLNRDHDMEIQIDD